MTIKKIILFTSLLFFASTLSAPSIAEELSADAYRAWLVDFKKELTDNGIRPDVIQAVFPKLTYDEKVVAKDRNQPEFKLTFNDYTKRVITEKKITKARAFYHENKKLIDQIAQDYGIQPKYLLALWGMESHCGEIMGTYYVPSSLSNLAYEGRRREFFKAELMKVFTLLNENKISPEPLKGSWAGAMGQVQFMPSSLVNFGVDYDKDGKIDIWNSKADIFASAANYLQKSGWDETQKWGREVRIDHAKDYGKGNCDLKKPLKEWRDNKITGMNNSPLPALDVEACLIIPDQTSGRAFLVYPNFHVIMKWNKSYFFALGTGLLADKIIP